MSVLAVCRPDLVVTVIKDSVWFMQPLFIPFVWIVVLYQPASSKSLLCVCMCLCAHAICVCVCVCLYVHACMCVCAHVCTRVRVCTRARVCVCLYWEGEMFDDEFVSIDIMKTPLLLLYVGLRCE